MPVHKIMDEMPYEELKGWFKYLNVRPDGWKEDLRTYQIMSAFAPMKQKPEDIFGTVKAVFAAEAANRTKFAEGAVPAGNFLAHMLQAKGGDSEFNLTEIMQEAGERLPDNA
jgi:hypothetical protein